jgi:hypothetical protein
MVSKKASDKDARLERGLKTSPTKMGPGTQLSAPPDAKTDGQELEEEAGDGEFQIPLQFTKSGRKRATPFPMKVCSPRLFWIVPCVKSRIQPSFRFAADEGPFHEEVLSHRHLDERRQVLHHFAP